MSNTCKATAQELLSMAGIKINGDAPWDIQVHNDDFYRRAITRGELGIGESYMDGWWDSESIDELICRILRARLDEKIRTDPLLALKILSVRFFNLQSGRRAFIVGEKHYDLGNDLFRNMLDLRMNYSCAYWKKASDLDQAQENKLDLICRKIMLKPGMRVLDIGCGWGAFARHASEKHGAEVVGITVSKQQAGLAAELCSGLPVEIRLQDYRDLDGKFDRIVSVGMFEHVGYKNYRSYFGIASKCLKEDGLFLLHTIGNSKTETAINPWNHKYIFPNGMLPSIAQIGRAIEGFFVMHDWHNFGAFYDKTLMAWYANFIKNWDRIRDKYPERFFRLWKFFLLSSAGGFRAGNGNQVWQIVLSKNGMPDGYESVR